MLRHGIESGRGFLKRLQFELPWRTKKRAGIGKIHCTVTTTSSKPMRLELATGSPTKKELKLMRLRSHAAALGGQCLATEYVNSRTKMQWQCQGGHEWLATSDSVLNQGTWCRECARIRARIGLQRLKDHAESLGGQCLATSYTSCKTKVAWRCSLGHEWQATPGSVLYKKCKHGHKWQATPKKVLRAGTWCPHCAKTAPIGLRRVQAHAVSLGGQCLTTSYQNSIQKLEWMCRLGHTWSTSANNVMIKGTWCPKCAATTWRTESDVRCVFEAIFFPAAFQACFPHFLDGLQLDGYCPELRLAFEYQGEQHYDSNHFFHSRDPTSFRKQQERDEAKAKRCQETGIRLVIVPYFVTDKRLHVQLALLQWFSLAEVNPIMLDGRQGGQY